MRRCLSKFYNCIFISHHYFFFSMGFYNKISLNDYLHSGPENFKSLTKKTRKIKNNKFREIDSFHFTSFLVGTFLKFIFWPNMNYMKNYGLLCMIYKDIFISLRHCIILVTVAWPWQPTGYLIIRN